MLNRRDFMKTAAVAGFGLLDPFAPARKSVTGAKDHAANTLTADFQTFLPKVFDGKLFGPEELTALEDEAGIDRFVVFPETTERPDNADLAKRIRFHPRIIGCASVNPALGPDAVRELETAVNKLGLRGVRLSPTLHRYPIDSEAVIPVLEKARELGIPVTMDGDSDNGRPSQIAAVASRFPEVAFILDMGFRAPVRPPGEAAGKEMIEVMKKRDNIYLGPTALTTCQPSYLMSTIWTGGPGRVVFGSNAPSGIPLFACKGIKWAELEPEAEAQIFGETLRKIYKLA